MIGFTLPNKLLLSSYNVGQEAQHNVDPNIYNQEMSISAIKILLTKCGL